MNVRLRQNLSAIGFFAIVAALLGGAASSAVGLRDQQAEVASLTEQAQALEARMRRIGPNKAAGADDSPFVDAATITLAGAALQQRVENAVAAVGGHLVSSKVEVGGRGAEKRVALEAELTVAQPDMQKLLYDLETGRPYLFAETFEARAPEKSDAQAPGDMRVTLTLTGQWSGPK